MAADLVTPEAINFMARHGRGLICLSLTEERVAQLGLPMMARRTTDRRGTRRSRSASTAGAGSPPASRRASGPRRSGSRSRATRGPTTSSRPGTSSRCGRGAAACWCARATPRARSTWRASRAASPPASSARSCARTARWRACPTWRRSRASTALPVVTIADLIEYRLGAGDAGPAGRARRRVRPRSGGVASEFRAYVYTTDVEETEYLALVLGDVKRRRAGAGARADRRHAARRVRRRRRGRAIIRRRCRCG